MDPDFSGQTRKDRNELQRYGQNSWNLLGVQIRFSIKTMLTYVFLKHGRISCRLWGPKCRHLIYVSSIHYEEAFPRKRRQLLVLWVIIWQSFSLSLCQKPCRNQMRTLYALKVKNNPWQWATSLHSWIIFCSFWSELSNKWYVIIMFKHRGLGIDLGLQCPINKKTNFRTISSHFLKQNYS